MVNAYITFLLEFIFMPLYVALIMRMCPKHVIKVSIVNLVKVFDMALVLI